MHAILMRGGAHLALTVLAAFTHSSAQPIATLDPISTIIDAYRNHTIVALDDDHGEERCAAFRLSLIRDPRFIEIVNDIVVEFGNSRYQAIIDAFVAGNAENDATLRAVWQDTTIPRPVWDRPVYEEFFRTVRSVNAGRPPERQLRVLLGDPPIDWKQVRTAADVRVSSTGRSTLPAEIIGREVIARNRRALVIYGALHLMRQNLQGANLIERIETLAPGSTFVVVGHPFANLAALGVDAATWKPPALVLTAGTSLANQIDAVLYLGGPSGRRISHLTSELCSDRAYRAMRVSRMSLAGDDKAQEHFDRECTIEK